MPSYHKYKLVLLSWYISVPRYVVSRSLKHSNTESINHAILLRLLVLLNKNRELYLVQIECKNKIYLVTRFMDSLITFYCRRLNIFVKVYIQICPCLTSDLTSFLTSNLTSCLRSNLTSCDPYCHGT